ncbi:MAG: HEAT repeat domain-containing protein, partial [Candidatus Hydrothermales bacterium]
MNEVIKIIVEIKKLEGKKEPEKILEYISHPSFLVREEAAKAISKTGKHLREKILQILTKGYWYEKAAC